MPAPVDREHLLALLTRVRAAKVAAGEIKPVRLYDLRTFKCCYAELEYLRRLAAAGRAGGTVVTSMRQLVAGLAPLHPEWRIDGGEGWEDRDRHHRAVRHRLRALQAMGLLRWRIGTNLDGEECRTELELLEAPAVSAEELAAAAVRLEHWQARYGPELNTGSSTGIIDALVHGRPLSASERQRRGCAHTRQATAARQRRDGGHLTISHPPIRGSSKLENTSVNPNASGVRDACERTGVTRASAHEGSGVNTAENEMMKTAGGGEGDPARAPVPDPGGEPSAGSPAAGGASAWDPAAIVARVREREAQRAPVLEAIAEQAAARAEEVAGWGLERSWPFSRLREAWVVVRWGPRAAADSGPAGAGPLYPDDYTRLRRAVARYERNQGARPEGYPAVGLGALMHLGVLARAGEVPGGPRTLRYAVGALDQLSRRMRAVGTADSAARAKRATVRVQRRHERARALPLTFRAQWPPWVLLDEQGQPAFDRFGLLEIDPGARVVPPVASDSYRMVVRDAYLLAGRPLPVDVDGRTQMALRHQRQIPRAERRPTLSDEQRELAELAHRTGQPQRSLARLGEEFRRGWLAQLRVQEAEQARREALAFKARLAELHRG